MFDRRVGDKPYSQDETQNYLGWLARKMQEHTLSVFNIEGLQPTWLPEHQLRHWQWYPRGVYVGVFGLSALLAFALFAPVVGFPILAAIPYGFSHLVWGLVYTDHQHVKTLMAHVVFGLTYFVAWAVAYASLGTSGLLLAGAVAAAQTVNSWILKDGFFERGNNPNTIRLVDRMTFSIRAVGSRVGFFASGLIGPAYTLAYAVFEGVDILSPSALVVTGISYVAAVFIVGSILGITSQSKTQRTRPNEGIIDTARNSLLLTFNWAFAAFLLIPALMIVTSLERAIAMSFILGVPISWAYLMAFSGGYPVVQHVMLRRLLRRNGSIPVNIARFLDYAASLILTRKVGGGYIFIHRYLLEYFAALEPASTDNR